MIMLMPPYGDYFCGYILVFETPADWPKNKAIRPYKLNCLFGLTWPQNSTVGPSGLVFLCKLVVFQLSRGLYCVVA